MIRLGNSLIKHPTCIKNPKNPNFIDLILKNKASACVIQAGLSDLYTFISYHQELSITEISRNLIMRNLIALQ